MDKVQFKTVLQMPVQIGAQKQTSVDRASNLRKVIEYF